MPLASARQRPENQKGNQEFLCILVIATYCAARWTNKSVLYVSDNQLAMRWITNLKARHQLANYFCGIFTLLMSRFRFEVYCVYINTKSNMRDEPSRVFDDDDIREGPGLNEIDAYMARVFPGMLEVRQPPVPRKLRETLPSFSSFGM